MISRSLIVAVLLLTFFPPRSDAQVSSVVKDTSKNQHLRDAKLDLPKSPEEQPNSLGVDILASGGGFGMGAFYRHEYSDVLSSFIDFSISEASDDNEKEYIDYFGNRFVPGKVNRFLVLPLFIGLEKRLFKDDIVDNFRPFVNAAIGPSMIYVFPYNEEYFTAIGKGTPKYTIGGYLGMGAYFGDEHSRIMGLNLRYYFLPYPAGLEDLQSPPQPLKKEFGGFYISLSFGGAV